MCQNCRTGLGPHSITDPTRRNVLEKLAAAGMMAATAPMMPAAAMPRTNSGPFPTIGYAQLGQGQAFERYGFERRALNADDVLIDIHYCGICHTDVHFANNDLGNAFWPLMPGHEIVGRVAAVGSAVKRFKVGDAAGVGCMVDSCGECEFCLQAQEQYCARMSVQTYGRHHSGINNLGGYSNRIVVREAFTIRIPEKMDLARAAPLLCAGVTTMSPLQHWKIGAGDHVAVVGLGGLGHVAVKLAAARGVKVTVFTTSPAKRDDALAMGASDVVFWPDAEAFRARRNTFDSILTTIPYAFDPNPFVMMLKTDRTMVNVGLLTPFSVAVNNVMLMIGRKSISSSLTGSLAETQQVIDFCAEHNIAADIEMVAISGIEEAMQRVKNKDVRYRFVIDMQTLT